MTNTSAAYDAATDRAEPTTTPASRRVTTIAALVGGGALVVDTVTITVIDSNFGVLDDVVFLVGLAALPIMLIAMGVASTRRARGFRRVALGAGVVVIAAVVLGLLSTAADWFGRHTFSDDNIGLHGEWSFFSIGVAMLAIAAWSARADR